MHNNYFEGTLQLRNPTKEVIDFVKSQCAKGKVFITKTVKEREGFDYYITSRKFLHTLGKRLSQQFNGELKVNPRIFTKDRQTSKDVYRITIMFRLFPYKKGDVLEHRGEQIRIVNISTKILAQNIRTGEKLWLTYDELR